MKLITVDGQLFNLDGSRYRIKGVSRNVGDGDLPDDIELIPWQEHRRQQEEAQARFVGPPRPIRFDYDEVMTW